MTTESVGNGSAQSQGPAVDFSKLLASVDPLLRQAQENERKQREADLAAMTTAAAPAAPAAPAASPAPAQPDYITELKRLAELRDMGIITAEDFEAKKNQLLGL